MTTLSDTLASALPADDYGRLAFEDARELVQIQAERLAEAGYVLVHTAPDEATVDWLAKSIESLRGTVIDGRVAQMPSRWMKVHIVRAVLAALADTSAQAGARQTADNATGGET